MDKRLEAQISEIPFRPGIYKFLDKDGVILYVGKANSLRSRVRSYFRVDHIDRPHIIPMIPLIHDIETIETENNIEAVVLESALIKEYLPKYNVEMKDDKSYAWLYINTHDEIPTVQIVRSINVKDYKKGRLFGPYPNGRAVWQVFRYIRKLHPFCTCNNPKEPCLYYRLGLCNNPTFGDHTVEEYRKGINEIIKFLSGRKKNHIKALKRKMLQYSKDRDYESAALLRDKISDLEHLGERITYYQSEEDFLSHQRKSLDKQLVSLQEDLLAEKLPERIECYDISNIQGKNAYGSMSVAIDGSLKSSDYRIFKIRGLDTPDDYGMLLEVIERRLKNIESAKDDSLSSKPDLIVIDGGKGQINKLMDVIPNDIVLLGISKGRSMKKKGKKQKDEFWLRVEGEVKQIRLRHPSLIIRLRDEAHRFAIKHHRKSRSKSSKISALDKITGVGVKRRKLLLKKFNSVENISKQTVESIDSVVKNKTVSKEIKQALNKDQSSRSNSSPE